MGRRPNPSSKRLERRAERQARQPGSAPRAPRQRQGRAAARGRSRGSRFNWLPVLAALGGAVLIALLVYLVLGANGSSQTDSPAWRKAELDSSPTLPGVYYPPHPGADGQSATADDRQHFGNGVVVPICTPEQMLTNQISNPLCYTSNPPTSGPHAQSPLAFKVLENPAPKENLIHNMEHAGIVIWYNTTNQDVIKQLESITDDSNARRRSVVMSGYAGMEPDTVAVTAWTRLDKFPVSEFNRKRVTDFIELHNKRFNPEGF